MLSGFSSGTNAQAELGLPELPMDEQRTLLNWSQSLRESITKDAKHRDFFDAVVNKRGAIPDMTARELAVYRSYVRNGDAPPLSKPEPEPSMVMQPPGATR